MLSACSRQPDFDAKSYVQSSLDAHYHGEYKDYANLLEISEKDAKKEIEEDFNESIQQQFDDSDNITDKGIVEKYHLALSPLAQKTLQLETPSEVPNVTNTIIGSVSKLCEYAKDVCTTLGYDVTILTDRLTCEAREAGMFLGSIALAHANTSEHLAFLAGGETVVHLMGKGLGGRNQEIALAAASQIEGIQNVAVFSFGSDGTDGPTDAAGGYVDGKTSRLVDIDAALKASDSYHALQKSGGLLVTGPTGTNVNDLAVVLIN